MPFYEYECQACKYYTEVMQKITDAPLTKCPSCGKRRLTKLVSAPVFRLKGGGWYETDFKGDSENKRNLLGADKDEPKTESKADAKAEAKPAATEAKPAADAKESKPAAEKAASGKPRASTSRARAKPKRAAGARKARR